MKYGRDNFTNPNITDLGLASAGNSKKGFYSDAESEDGKLAETKDIDQSIDADHRLLLSSCLPLLNSRSSAVVLAVATLFYYLAPPVECQVIGKPLVRLMRSPPEVLSVVLTNISTMSAVRPVCILILFINIKNIFAAHMKEFYVRHEDPVYIKKLKLAVLTNLASESNISQLLREFQVYVNHSNKEFVSATVRSIGRCSFRIPDIADSCLQSVMQLLHSESALVVTEAVLVVKNILQSHESCREPAMPSIARQVTTVTAAEAKAALVWIIGEYQDIIREYVPDLLRQLVKDFSNEETCVKLQILTLAVKCYLCNSDNNTVHQLLDYVCSLGVYCIYRNIIIRKV